MTDTHELTLATLDECMRLAGLRKTMRHGGRPFVGYVPSSDGRTIGGRYFPSRNAVLVYVCRDEEITRASVHHELAHALQYMKRCGGTGPLRRRRCGYVGQHDAAFYRDLEKLHRTGNVGKVAAVAAEGSDRHSYPIPKHWEEGGGW